MSSAAGSAPGSLTVPPLDGWEGLVLGLLAAVVIGVAFLLVDALGTDRSSSAEWQEWLDGRSRSRSIGSDEPVPSDGRVRAATPAKAAGPGTHLRP